MKKKKNGCFTNNTIDLYLKILQIVVVFLKINCSLMNYCLETENSINEYFKVDIFTIAIF